MGAKLWEGIEAGEREGKGREEEGVNILLERTGPRGCECEMQGDRPLWREAEAGQTLAGEDEWSKQLVRRIASGCEINE